MVLHPLLQLQQTILSKFVDEDSSVIVASIILPFWIENL